MDAVMESGSFISTNAAQHCRTVKFWKLQRQKMVNYTVKKKIIIKIVIIGSEEICYYQAERTNERLTFKKVHTHNWEAKGGTKSGDGRRNKLRPPLKSFDSVTDRLNNNIHKQFFFSAQKFHFWIKVNSKMKWEFMQTYVEFRLAELTPILLLLLLMLMIVNWWWLRSNNRSRRWWWWWRRSERIGNCRLYMQRLLLLNDRRSRARSWRRVILNVVKVVMVMMNWHHPWDGWRLHTSRLLVLTSYNNFTAHCLNKSVSLFVTNSK